MSQIHIPQSKDVDGARMGTLSSGKTVFVWVSRKDDGEDDDRVAVLTVPQALRFAKMVIAACEKSARPGTSR